MTREQFLTKYELNQSSLSYYKMRFPKFIENKKLNYVKLDEEIKHRNRIKAEAGEIAINLKPEQLEFLYKGSDKRIKAQNFLDKTIYRVKERRLIQDATYEKYIKIIEIFGEKQ